MTNLDHNTDTQAKKQRAKAAFARGLRVIDKEYRVATSPAYRYCLRIEPEVKRL